ncbi:hypothetical protein INN71_00250 [Nocardioides sp. ChNu-153]|uniref:hypothetical protein n=1 Tax=Nocardioides sp. ChNu-153 TaxID=2779364 RepID=UPI00264DFA72|nr:hypothetical protein [Nocardioides sp. ChNu-153]MDN7119816.1 hypothetical protein [Nocardioides sp. ChNu-153]
MSVPTHLVLGGPDHGVARCARDVAGRVGARVVTDAADLRPGERVHLHLTDRVVADDLDTAAREVEALAARVRLTVTLHDVPQPTDGRAFDRRVDCYRRVVAAAGGWATNSEHERAGVEERCAPPTAGVVVPLPVVPAPGGGAPTAAEVATAAADAAVAVFGFVYPGKGHAEALEAVAALRAGGREVTAAFLGAPAPGHAQDLDALVRRAADLGVPLRVTGAVPDDELVAALRGVAVAVVGHRNVSASGSLNSWLAAGRRPLVRDGAYAREMAGLRPGTVVTYRDDDLVPALAAALDDPAATWLAPGTDLRPGPDEVAAAYRAWWDRLAEDDVA